MDGHALLYWCIALHVAQSAKVAQITQYPLHDTDFTARLLARERDTCKPIL